VALLTYKARFSAILGNGVSVVYGKKFSFSAEESTVRAIGKVLTECVFSVGTSLILKLPPILSRIIFSSLISPPGFLRE